MKKIPRNGFAFVLSGAATFILIVHLCFVSCGRDRESDRGGGSSAAIASSVQDVTPCPEQVEGNVAMQDSNTFSPAAITLPPNSIVKWTNDDPDTSHHVYSYNHPVNGWFRSPDISLEQSVCFKFTEKGTYPYKCLGEGMTGVIIIQ